MFWDSVLSGLVALFEWPILIGIGFVLAVSLLRCLASFRSTIKRMNADSLGRRFTLFGKAYFIEQLFKAITVLGFLLICTPSIIGYVALPSPEVIGILLWPAIKYTLIVSVVVSLLEITPIIGHIIDEISGMSFFIRTALVLKPLAPIALLANNSQASIVEYATPSLWACAGYLLIAYILVKAIWFSLLGIIVFFLRRRGGHISSDDKYYVGLFGGLLLIVIDAPFGVVPLLMYGQYIANSFQMA